MLSIIVLSTFFMPSTFNPAAIVRSDALVLTLSAPGEIPQRSSYELFVSVALIHMSRIKK